MSTQRRVLVIGPVFHGYTATIGQALTARGHRVTTHAYDARSGILARARTKVVEELPELVGVTTWPTTQRRATAAAVAAVRDVRPHLVLAVKADVLTTDFWDAARGVGATTHLWLYDELHRMRLDSDVLGAVDVVTSYSKHDTATLSARGIPATHVANGFDARLGWRPVPSDDVLFVGARYPNRERLLVELRRRGVPVRAVGRDWSGHPWDRLRTWDPRRPDVPGERDVSRSKGYGMMAGAAANLNIHYDQDGFTMRTFEIPGTGGLQLVDRPDVAELYAPGEEVLVYADVDEAADLAARAVRDRSWARRIGGAGRRRTLADHTMDHRVAELERLWA
ncbi:MAG TPA: glycosyltransferase [Phycicoccus sp.]|nr:glycosyltransferase [Phycicoccus sp.]